MLVYQALNDVTIPVAGLMRFQCTSSIDRVVRLLGIAITPGTILCLAKKALSVYNDVFKLKLRELQTLEPGLTFRHGTILHILSADVLLSLWALGLNIKSSVNTRFRPSYAQCI